MKKKPTNGPLTFRYAEIRDRLEAVRKLYDLPVFEIIERTGMSRTAIQRYRKHIREERGEPSMADKSKSAYEIAKAWVGDRDPSTLTNVQAMNEAGITRHQSARVMGTLRREYMAKQTVNKPKPAQAVKVDHAVPKPGRMFWVVGDRLFSVNRQPEEVGV